MASIYKIADIEFHAAYIAWKTKRQQAIAAAEASATDQVKK
jgi:hypothetical protein